MNLLEKYPFVSIIYNKKIEMNIPVVINLISKQHISYFDINDLDKDDVKDFFELVISWWNHNHQIPLTLYYKDEIEDYDYALKFLENREYEIVDGCVGTNLKNLSEKRIKRKIITIE